MNFYEIVKDLFNARDYLFNKEIVNPDLIIFINHDGTAIQMDDIDISINGNCIQLMVK